MLLHASPAEPLELCDSHAEAQHPLFSLDFVTKRPGLGKDWVMVLTRLDISKRLRDSGRSLEACHLQPVTNIETCGLEESL